MKRIISLFSLLFSLNVIANSEIQQETCVHWLSFFKPYCQRLHQVWSDGDLEIYLSGYAWHNRYTYRPEKIKTYNEEAWGTGLGKGLFDEKGNWHGLYLIAFLDSHKNIEPAAGYAYLKVITIYKDLRAGVGYSVLITARPDINHGYPFPGVLPWASIFYKKVSLAATYIPGSSGAGNVLYILGKYTF